MRNTRHYCGLQDYLLRYAARGPQNHLSTARFVAPIVTNAASQTSENSAKKQPAVIVLAAGRGSRFKGTGHKLTQRLGVGTVLSMTLEHAISTQLQVVTVTTTDLAELMLRDHPYSNVVILSEATDFGMGQSIVAGVKACVNAAGWLILPADMPLIRTATIRAVAAHLAGNEVVFAQSGGKRGHPVGFSASLREKLLALGGDEGARRIIASHAAFGVEIDDPGVLLDIDTASDLSRARELLPV